MDLADVPVVDGHCHPFTAEHQRISEQQLRDILLFMQEGGAPAETVDTLTAHLFIRELAGLLDCPREFAEVLQARNQAASGDYAAFVERVLEAARATALVVDTGYPYWKRVDIDQCSALVKKRQVREVFRVETAFRGGTSIYFDSPELDFGAYPRALPRRLLGGSARAGLRRLQDRDRLPNRASRACRVGRRGARCL